MSKKSVIISLFVIISMFLSGIVAIVRASPLAEFEPAPLNVLAGYAYQANLEVKNNALVPLPTGYTVTFTLNTSALISQNRLKSDCNDLRITFNGGAEGEIDRLVTGCNSTSTQVQFRTQSEIAASPTTDTNYQLYYGNLSAGTPPQNPTRVFAFYDNFDDGDAVGWTPEGTWAVVPDVGSNYVYRYTTGGTNWALTQAALSASDIDYIAKVRAVDIPNTNWIGLAFRIQDANNFLTFYQSRDSDKQFKYARIINDNHSILLNPPFFMNANTWHWIRLQALGSQVRSRIWQDGSAEPTTWNISTTETTYQTSANIGLTLYNHTTIADWDEVSVKRLVAMEPSVSLGAASWWDSAWGYRRQITVANTSTTTPLQTHYTASFTLDTAALIGSGQMMVNCDDLRLVYDPGLSAAPIDRLVENCNTSQTTIWYALQRPVSPGGQDKAYYLYSDNSLADAPPANGMNVFLFFEDWEQGATHWTTAGGLDAGNTGTMGTTNVSTAAAYSVSHSQLLTATASGGDAFSGYIPVTANTGYTFSIWGSTSSVNICTPVGLNSYTSNSPDATGVENWFWAENWPTSSTWAYRAFTFTTSNTAAYIKLKSELWNDPSCLGSGMVYLDNLALRYSIGSEPNLTLGTEEGTLPSPAISNIMAISPINIGSTASVSANIAASQGVITSATLKIISPQTVDISMTLTSGTTIDGTWQASGFTPAFGGVYTYRIQATSNTGRSRLSEEHTFTVSDATPPVISPFSKIDPIMIRNTQTLIVQVTDNGLISSVNVTVGGIVHPMTANGDQYSYSWLVTMGGTIPYSVTAIDSANNSSTLDGSFVSQVQEVDVCTWNGCRQGAASWSIDDGNNSCRTELESAGIRGTFYAGGSSTQDWYATYSAAGHEIASHTVSHPCNTPSCSPTCTAETLAGLPVVPSVVTSYRQNEIEPNIVAIEAGTGKPVVSLAWPCGCTDPSRMQAASYSVLGARGYYDYIAKLAWVEGINNPIPVNFMLLNTAASYRQDFIDQAYAEGKWATVTSHGSCDGISYMGAQSANGHLWVAPIGNVLKYIKVRDASQLTNYNRAGRTISFDAVHNLPTFLRPKLGGLSSLLPIDFDNPVTLKVHILETDTVLGVTVGGAPVAYSIQSLDGTRYVTFDTPLNTSRHIVITLGAPAPVIGAVSSTASPIELGTTFQVSTGVTASESSLKNVIMRVLAPEPQDHPMELVSGQYTVTFIPSLLGTYSYQIIATNAEDTSTQSAVNSFSVIDTTPPQTQFPAQNANIITINNPVTLSAQGKDIGGLARAILWTDETGVWQGFDWPVTDWWNYNWSHRRMVTLTESTNLSRSNEMVDLAISSEVFTGLTSCSNELRVADNTKAEIPSQVYGEQVNGSVRTCHLLFPATVAANTSRSYYVYYGNTSAMSPVYTSDLSAIASSSLRTIQNSTFNLDINTASGIISRLRLLAGSNIDLPLSSSANFYWGWHQVCSSDGNITGQNNLCLHGAAPAPASGLTMVETISGPLLREYTFTSVKTNTTYTITFRFYAYAPYYQYFLSRTGTTSMVMNNFWYQNGYFDRLGAGTGGTPSSIYNTYDDGSDHVRISSFGSVAFGSIDGTNNDGTDLGGTDYETPTANELNLSVVAGASQSAAQNVLAQIQSPLSMSVFGNEENAPAGQYGSPIELVPGVGWTTTAFTWQHATINNRAIHWRIRYCDVSGNCANSSEMTFQVGAPTAVTLNSFSAGKSSAGVRLAWSTVSDSSTAGFNLYRREASGSFIKVNETLIPIQLGGQPMGGDYTYLDTNAEPGRRYEYKLETIDTSLNVSATTVLTYWPFTILLPLLIH